MEKNGEQIIKQGTKTKQKIIIGYIICIIAIILALYSIYYREKNMKPEPIDFATNAAVGMQSNKYAYLDVQSIIGEVATYGTGDDDKTSDRYYLAFFEGYPYIINLSAEGEEDLKEIIEYYNSETVDEEKETPDSKRVYGVTEEIPTELKQIIIEYFKEIFNIQEDIPIENFENYFGSVLLNTRKEPVDTIIEEMVIIFGCIGIILLIIEQISSKIVAHKTMKYLRTNQYKEDVENQLDDFVEEKFFKDKVIFTKDYFVDLQKGLVVFKYSDIKWIYVHTVKYMGIFTIATDAIVYLKDGKTNMQVLQIKKKATKEFTEVFNKLCEKAPVDSLKGYTSENIKEFKEYKKELNNKNI